MSSYKFNDKTQISTHFNVQEFRCKCGKAHNILIDSSLVKLLEELRTLLNARSCNIYSGHRCAYHDKKVGGSGNGSHTGGFAVDCYFLDQNKKRIPSYVIASYLEDLGHKYGIGIRCGGSSLASGNIHIDTKYRKWYGDEKISFSTSISSNNAISDGKKGHKYFYTYSIKPNQYYTTAKSGLNVRDVKGNIVDCLKLGTKIDVYFIYNGRAKIGFNRYVVTDYIK